MRNTYKYILLSILALGALSCNKSEIEEEKSNDISFEVFTGAAANSGEATKGERYNSEADFKTDDTLGLYAWNSSVSDTQVYENEPVSKTGGKWVPKTSKKWEDRDSYVFEAVYPQPTSSLGSVGLTAFTPSTNPANLTFSYTIPTTTGDAGDAVDKDFMLAYYSGKGNEGKAPLTFTHPLTCVNFKAGTITGISTINSITIEGVYASGSCTVRLATYTYNSTDRQCYSYEADDAQHTSLWTPSGSTSVTGASSITASTIAKTTWAYNFLLIPQDTETKEATIKVNVTTTSGKTYNLKTTISTDYWRAGHTNTYKINFSFDEIILDPVEVNPWNKGLEGTPTFEKIPHYFEGVFDYGEGIEIDGTIWAPVNCGIGGMVPGETKYLYPYGKLYQLGRKYGQGYDGDATYPSGDKFVTGPISYIPSASDAEKFYTVTASPYNWYNGSSPAVDELWGASKTTYDPCPDGWRVPTEAELTALMGSHTSGVLQDGNHGNLTNIKGKYFDGSTSSTPTSGVFLPAAGYRSGSNGSAHSRGTNGYYCSSSVFGNYGRGLHFNSGSADLNDFNRASGDSVRCVYDR